MRTIYSDSFRFFLSSLPILLGFAAMIEVALWVFQPKREFSVTFPALVIIAYFFHRHFLFGEQLTLTQKPAAGAPPAKFGWFMLVSSILILTPLALGFAVALGLLDRPPTLVVIMTFLLFYLVTLSLFGLALPAAVARDNTYRIAQGLRVAFSTMWRLVLGPGVVGLLVLLGLALIDAGLKTFAVPENSILTLSAYILARTLGFITTITAVAVLCEMYHRTRPMFSG